MPIRSPLGLGLPGLGVALAALVLAQPGARAEPSAGTWTDPPPRSAAPAAVAPPRAEPAQAAEPAAKSAIKSAVRSAATASARSEPKVRKSAHTARATPSRRTVAARPVVARHERSVRRAPVRPIRVARPVYRDWPSAEPAPQPYYPMPQAYDPRDPRLERLWSAEEAGYLAVRGRHVAYPDGRVLRIYRPRGEDEDLD